MARGRMREASRNFIPLRINDGRRHADHLRAVGDIVSRRVRHFSSNPRMQEIAELFNPIGPSPWLYYIVMAVLIMLFTYFYTSIIFNPVDIAENLKKQGGFVPGVKPGAKTAEYIEQVIERITLPGSVFLAAIAVLPMMLANLMNIPFLFGGTSLLIVVGVALDTMSQMQQHLLLRKYDGFMKKGRVRFRGRQASGI